MVDNLRSIHPLDSHTLLFMVMLGMFVFLRVARSVQFTQLTSLQWMSSTTTAEHTKKKSNFTLFNFLFLLLQGLVVALLTVDLWGTPFTLFSKVEHIFFFCLLYMLFHAIIGMISLGISVLIGQKRLVSQYLKLKIGYFNILVIPLWTMALISVYTPINAIILTYSILITVVTTTLIFVYVLWSKFKDVIVNHWFYFILYFCALEIAPYLIVYHKLVSV